MDFNWSVELFPRVWSIEFLGFITGLLSVFTLLFTRLQRIQWTNWLFGVVSGAVYFQLFHTWHLLGNMWMQIPFVVIGLQGAYVWRGQLRGIVTDVREIPTTFVNTTVWRVALLLALLAEFGVYPILDHYGDASPLWDGLILTISMAALILQLRKYTQSWYLWILVDIIAVPFHISQDRVATGTLYFVYLIMCFFGLYTWWQEARKNETIRAEGTWA